IKFIASDGSLKDVADLERTDLDYLKEAFKDVNDLFENKTAAALQKEVADAKIAADSEAELDKLRREYDIEIFNEGKTYYKMAIRDQYIGYANAIQRNSVYQLKVNNVFNVGAQVPNGTPDKEGLFYLDVTVSVNPWVLNTQEVELK
ncbi:MAG TPA: fimbria major subunit, partial [Segatella copri]|nr:fimbria major subunit [Segatella copri]